MAKTINVPGVGEAQVPDSATDAEIVAFVKKVQAAGSVKAAYEQALAERPGAFMSGVYGAGSDLAATLARVTDEAGLTPAVDFYGLSESLGERAAQYTPTIGGIENVGGIGDLLTYAGELAAQSAPRMIATGAAGYLGGPRAGFAVGAPLFTGSNLRRQAEEQGVPLAETELRPAVLAAIPQAGAELIPLQVANVFKTLKTASDPVRRSLAREIVTRAAKVSGTEALTETGQQALEILQANPDKLLELDDQTVSELINAAVGGALLGGVLGGGMEALQVRGERKAEERAAERESERQDLVNFIQREADEGRGIDIRSETNLGIDALKSRQATPNLEVKKIKQVVPEGPGKTAEREVYTVRDLGDNTKGKVNIGLFANEESARQAIAGYQSLIAAPAKAAPAVAAPVPKTKIKTKITGEEKKPAQPPLPAEAPTPAPGLGKAVSELPKVPDSPVPEAPATFDKQREALQRETRAAILYNTTDPVPPKLINPRIKRIKLDDGRVIDFNRKRFTEAQVREAVANNRLNEVLELGPFNREEAVASELRGNAPVAVVERTPDGIEVKAAAGTTETAPAQVEALERTKTAPENRIVVEPVQDLVAGRLAPELSADERVAIWKSVAPQAESFRELTPDQQNEYFVRLKAAQDAREKQAAPAAPTPQPKPIIKKPSPRAVTADDIELDLGQIRAIRESIIPSGRVVDAPIEKRKEFFFAVQAAKQREADLQNEIRAERASPKKREQNVFDDLSDELMGLSADDAPKSRYRTFIKKAIKLGAMTEADTKELEYIFKDKDMSNDDLNSEIDSILRANESDQKGGKKLSAAPAGGVAPEATPAPVLLASRPEIATKFADIVKKRMTALGLKNVGIRIDTAVKTDFFGRYASGAYDPATKAIEISLSSVDPSASEAEFLARLEETFNHEAIHAVVDLGVISRAEFATLIQAAEKTKYPGSNFTYLDRAFATYSEMLTNDDGTINRLAVAEEAIAEMFRDWNAGRLKVQEKPEGLFKRIREFFRRLRSSAKEAGFNEIFEQIESGEIAKRQAAPTEGGVRKLSALPSYLGTAEGVDREAQKNKALSRAKGFDREYLARTPELQEAVQKRINNEITQREYERIVDQYRPVMPFDFEDIPTPTPPNTARQALSEGRGQSPEKGAKYGVPSATLKDGDPAQLRLDIPSYTGPYNAWVVSVHTPDSLNPNLDSTFKAGKVVGYESVARITDAYLGVQQKPSQMIAVQAPKGTIATMLGKWKPISPEEAYKTVQEVFNDPNWRQVGMDPFRHSYFYDRKTMEPIFSAEDIIQVGPLVMAKNVNSSRMLSKVDPEASFVQKKYSIPARLTGDSEQEFARWWKRSKAVDRNGKPRVYYHGRPRPLREGQFNRGASGALPGEEGPYYFSPNAYFASDYSMLDLSKGGDRKKTETGTMYPVFLSVQNPWDYEKASNVDDVIEYIAAGLESGEISKSDLPSTAWRYGLPEITPLKQLGVYLEKGDWDAIELPFVQRAIRDLGFDGFYLVEDGVRNLAVYKPQQIKSIYNQFEPGTAESRKLSIAPRYTRSNEQYEPERNERGSVIKFITQAMKAKQADAAFARLDEANRMYPRPLADRQSWLNRLSFAYNQRDGIIMPPDWLIGMTNDLPRWTQWMKLTPDQLKTVNQGFELVDQLNDAYKNGTATPEVTANLFMWVYMSRMASAFPHEAGYLDVAEMATPFIRKAIAGRFTASPELLSMTSTGKAAKQAKANAGFADNALPADVAVAGRSDLDDWFLMVRDALPDDSPGNAVTNNLNSFGRDFLFTMAKKQDGNTKLKIIHDALVSDMSGKDVRRLFHKVRDGGKVGFDNKILSFALLLAGKRDVVVLDRIQINQLFGGGQTNKIYDDVAKGFDGPRGLAVYEALEAGINQKIEDLYSRLGRPQDGSTGRLHWESWIRSSGQEVAHPTIKALVDLARGNPNPFLDIGAREGRFHRTMFGVQYIRRSGGKQDFVYTTRSGAEFAFDKDKIDDILSSNNLKKSGIVPKWFPGVSDFEGGAISWRDYPGVKIAELERIVATNGRPINNEAIREKSSLKSGKPKGADTAGSGGRGGTSAADAGNRVRWELGRRPAGGSNKARIPESFDRKDRAASDGNVIAEHTLKPRAEEIFREAGVATPTFLELTQTAENAKRFADAIAQSKSDSQNGAAVLLYNQSDYAKMRLFLTEDGMTGFAIKDGNDIVSVFNNPKSGRKAASITMLQLAIQQGGRKLDCFDTILPTLYSNSGMVATSRIKFSDRQKPEEWNYDSFADFNSGRPDVVFMVFDPASWSVYKPTDGDLINTGDTEEAENNDYGTAAEIQSNSVFDEEASAAAAEAKKQEKAARKLSVAPAYNNIRQFTAADADRISQGLSYGAGIEYIQKIVNSKAVKRFVPERFRPTSRATSRFMANWADKMIPVGEMIDYIRKNGGKVTDVMDTYMQEELMHGSVAEDLNARENGLYKNLMDYLKKSGVKLKATDEEARRGDYGLEDYLYARHAKERNQRIRDVGNKDPEKGSGMTDAEADEILAAVDRSPKKKEILESAKLFDKIIEDTNRVRIEAGLTPDFSAMEVIDEDGNKVIADMRVFKYYAPLRGFLEENLEYGANPEEELRIRTGTGLNVRGREDKQAMGRKSRASDIVAHAILQNSEAVIRAAKNRVGNSLIRLVEANPKQAEEFGIKLLKKAPTRAVINKNGVIQTMVDPMFKQRPDILIVKAMPDAAKGLKGGEQVIFEVSNEALQKALIAKKVTGSAMAEKILSVAQTVNRWVAMVNTGLNPEFMLTNFPRDVQTALINIEQYQTPGIRKKVMKDVLPAMRGAWNVMRNPDAKGFWEDAFRDFKQQGGMTAGISGVRGIEERISEIGRMIKDPKGDYQTRAKEGLFAVKGFLEDMNSAVENAIRLSVYKNLADNGFTKQRAAQASKNLTVNFDKRGEYGPAFNALYLFFNASVQGTLAMGIAAARSPRVRKILGGIVLLGVMQDVINSLLSPEDEDGKKIYDKIPEYKLRTNLIIVEPFGITDRGYLSIPLPYGYNAFFNMGRALTRRLRNEYSTLEATNSIMGTAIDAFNPIGGTENLLNAVSPTIADPIVSLYLNEDFTGRKIYPEAFPGATPKSDSNTYWTSTNPIFKSLTQFLNSATGGSEYVPGMVDISPDVVEYLYDYIFGGVGKFVTRTIDTTVNTIPAALTGDLENIELNNVPVLRKLVGNVSERVITEGYMANANYLLSRGKELEAAVKSGDSERIKETREKYRDEIRVYPRVKALVNRRNRIASDLRKLRENPRIPEEQKRNRIQQMQKQIVEVTAEVNKIYESVAGDKFPSIF